MRSANLVYIISDQHTINALGCYGNEVIQTPNLDRLAERGTRFSAAYTNCPICVPARASLMTGRYVHDTGNWDNSFPYNGSTPGWGHRLKEQGYRVDSIGKLHFRSTDDDNGFTKEVDPLHLFEGIGDLLSCIRDNSPPRDKTPGLIQAGPGDSTYLRYDASTANNTCRWLADRADDEKPWVVFASFVCPHPPYIAPEKFFNLYPLDKIPLPPQWQPNQWPNHPVMNYFRKFFKLDTPLDEQLLRRVNAAYYGVCTYLDHQLGRVLQTIEDLNLSHNTRIIYTSDHGESLGARGLTGKFTLYDESVAVPFIMAGPDVPRGKVVNTPISLVDSFPTILDAVGASPTAEDADLPGHSLWPIAQDADQDRTVFSEYHALGSRSASYMLRDQSWKYIYHVNARPQLFNMQTDPNEINDLSADPACQMLLKDFEARLRTIVDPEAVDAQAKSDQTAQIEAFGGRAAVIKRGAFTNSPTPGEKANFKMYS